MKTSFVEVGKLGRTIGFDGALVFHSSSDFLSFLQPKTKLLLQNQKLKPKNQKSSPSLKSNLIESNIKSSNLESSLTIKSFSHTPTKNIISFDEITSKEQAQRYVNAKVFTTQETTRKLCALDEGEFFYFDVIGCRILECDVLLGEVVNIERIGNIDYFIIKATTQKPKTFMLPYIDRYVKSIDIKQKEIRTIGAKDILEQS